MHGRANIQIILVFIGVSVRLLLHDSVPIKRVLLILEKYWPVLLTMFLKKCRKRKCFFVYSREITYICAKCIASWSFKEMKNCDTHGSDYKVSDYNICYIMTVIKAIVSNVFE